MPRRCVAMYCSQEFSKLYEWPKEKSRARLWTSFVQTKRADFIKPTKYSSLCYKHFSDDCFENLQQFRDGYAQRLLLTSVAVPTIQSSPPDHDAPNAQIDDVATVSTPQPSMSRATPKLSSAFRKREIRRLVEEATVQKELDEDAATTDLYISRIEPLESTTTANKLLRRTDSIPDPPTDLEDPANYVHSFAGVSQDHNYCSSAEPGALAVALSEMQQLQGEHTKLQRQIEELLISSSFTLRRFAASDEDIQYYSGFESYCHLKFFWNLIEQAAQDIVRGTRTERVGREVPTSLRLIDEFFLFMMYLTLDLELRDLADRFELQQETVRHVITSWAYFLYMILGAVGIWQEQVTVKKNLPEVFSEFTDTHIILVWTELRCQTPEGLLQTNLCISNTSHCSFKGLIGLAPHGPVIFVSPLFEGSISEREILKHSGLIPLLSPTMAVIMVDEGFVVEDLVPCRVYTPAFMRNKHKQLSEYDGKTQSVRRLSVHVGRLVRRVKEHRLFNSVIPMSLSGCLSQLFAITCLMLNYQNKPFLHN